ncbi:patatin [Pseudomonas syringae]|uniref:CBASS cGAMP-activated phospholipase n=1 Tax=Pseudomonas syringae TaxID=317 RepID=UPI000C1CA3CA|nr:CBASS cGAMP-activated phospholipase [Pseudomonas syringae]PIO92322.1 patatin [Pseudomonas syringae]POD32323.1 patatin [Pseudomonas syringae pv. syringae]POP78429.1 patatin [Pseudomonas syringae]
MTDDSKDLPIYHVLALSGGGYRALYTATILKEFEQVLGRPIASHFDLICGTSAGGLLALGLASEIPASELKSLFEDQGKQIFGSRDFMRRRLGFLTRAKHSNGGLSSVLHQRFGATTMGDLKHRVLIPAVNYTTGRGQFFKTPHHPSFELDHRMSLVDVALATSAAPVYFPSVRNDRGVFVDGGLVGNAPGLFGLHEVRTFLAPNQDIRVRVLAIGTMTVGATVSGGKDLDQGVIGWGGSLFDLVISAQESSVDYMLTQSLGDCYFKIDDQVTPQQSSDVKALDDVSEASTNTLRDRGMAAAQRALGDRRFIPFRGHQPKPPTFFHGPNKNSGDL